jgi:DNA helicase-2/ATP-dependent DNA helicase PcrA
MAPFVDGTRPPAMTSLNPAQRAAVAHDSGPLLVLAGAGSGKTRVITARVARLIEAGVAPEAILAVSFTNKSAAEMRERMVPLVGKARAGRIVMSTFHSFGLQLLKQEQKALGLDGRFVIFDQSDSLGVVKEVLRELFREGAVRKLDPMGVLSRISNWKSALLAPDAVPESDFEYDDVAREVYPEYQARLGAMRAVDFDDLVCRPVQLLASDVGARLRWQRRFEHLLVDEFQDTSKVQLELVRLLVNASRNVCVVGDDDQSIYSWRGADVKNILDFERHFPGAKIVKLEDNYRSHAPILEVANAVIAQSQGRRHGKTLRAARAGGDPVKLCACKDPADEARFVATEVGRLRGDGIRPSAIAVLYRSNLQARLIEEELKLGGHPHKVFGGQQFFDRKEVKDGAAYLRVVVNPFDEISLRRILNYPARGCGTRTVEHIEQYAKAHKLPFHRALEQIELVPEVPDNARRSLQLLTAELARAREQMQTSGRLHTAARELLERIGLREALIDAADGKEQGAQRWQNVTFFLGWLERYEAAGGQGAKSLQGFLERVTLGGDSPQEEAPGEIISLMTLHSAKGLEFSHVFLIGCVEGQIPHARTTDPKASEAGPADLEEERRLFYVGVTRARNRLYLSWPAQRSLRGKVTEQTRSRYLEELPEASVEVYDNPAKAPETGAKRGLGPGTEHCPQTVRFFGGVASSHDSESSVAFAQRLWHEARACINAYGSLRILLSLHQRDGDVIFATAVIRLID